MKAVLKVCSFNPSFVGRIEVVVLYYDFVDVKNLFVNPSVAIALPNSITYCFYHFLCGTFVYVLVISKEANFNSPSIVICCMSSRWCLVFLKLNGYEREA